MGLAAGTKLGPYEIQSALGAGGMGEVYRARDTRLERTVAIKILPEHLSSNSELRARFEREARAVSSLNHPHICHLYDIGSQDGTAYLVMEYLEGETLADRLRKSALPLKQSLEFSIHITEALAAAHHGGILHRDLKPGNVMLTSVGAKLLDFGLAKVAPALGTSAGVAGGMTPSTPTVTIADLSSPSNGLTQRGTLVGTFQYMAPEVLQGAEADARSDIFSLGCVLYEMVTGRRAFEGKSQLSVLTGILEKDPDPVSRVQKTSPLALDHVVKTCLEKNPEERFQNANEPRKRIRRNHPLLMMAVRAGLRRGELVAVKWGDVQLGADDNDAARFILVQHNYVHREHTTTKSKKSRRVDLSRELRRVLVELRDKRLLEAYLKGKDDISDELVFRSPKGTILNLTLTISTIEYSFPCWPSPAFAGFACTTSVIPSALFTYPKQSLDCLRERADGAQFDSGHREDLRAPDSGC